MMLIDTHCHLDFGEFEGDREEVIERASSAGVGVIINVGSSLEGSLRSLELAKNHRQIYCALGIHPHDAENINDSDLKRIAELARSKEVVAIGEIGLDYYRDVSPRSAQRKIFRSLLEIAKASGLPVIIHSRDAGEDALAILKESLSRPIKGVMHCFSGEEPYMKKVIELGMNISFTCNLTFKKADRLRAVAKKAPIERLLLETDAPFLAPQGFRGRRNEPAYLTYLVDMLSGLKELSAEDIARITTLNAAELFGLDLGNEVRRGKLAYKIRDSLYLNITNECTGGCIFCVRSFSEYVKGHHLRLESEPGVSDIMAAIDRESGYKEVVFCGYGEPLIRIDVVKEVSKRLKERGIYVRLDTNGHGNLIHKRSVVGELAGRVDEVSVSLNAEDEEGYNRICRPKFGPGTFEKVKEFIVECRDKLPKVSITCIDMPGVDIPKCKRVAQELKVGFRLRRLHEVG